MPPKDNSKGALPKGKPKEPPPQAGQKRKAPIAFDKSTNNNFRSKRQTTQRDARTIAAQTSSNALQNGALNLDKFVRAREYEIRALEDAMQRSKKSLTTRAFQNVPKELRRRTASHNAARVPKRLRTRAKREMREDNTPTVTARRRKMTRHMRLRMETVKKLRAMGAKRRAARDKGADGEVKVIHVEKENSGAQGVESEKIGEVKKKEPRRKRNKLSEPPVPKAKFRKRQRDKSWLPTHLFHAKRAHMTTAKEPLWRFAMPITPTTKSYRPTHRAVLERGAAAWDISYMATIGVEGVEKAIEGLLKGLGVSGHAMAAMERKWRSGTRTWQGWTFVRDEKSRRAIAPVTIIWCPLSDAEAPMTEENKATQGIKMAPKRKVLMRVHPSAFYQLWEEVVRLCKVQKPQVVAEDLRFEIGSIEIAGPGSTEALHGALWSSDDVQRDTESQVSHASLWQSLVSVTNPSSLPKNALLSFSIQDPRLHHPPRTVEIPGPDKEVDLFKILAEWPADSSSDHTAIFDHKVRRASARALPSQKAINRRKAEATPGSYPDPRPQDPRIPILLYTSRTESSPSDQQTSWTILLPWNAVQPVWYSIMYYPLSTGGQVRFGGLREQRQVAFESGAAWFPGDFPGTDAGDAWEAKESARRKVEWDRRPKGKRVEYSTLDLGLGRKGEIGHGWACDWDRLINGPLPNESDDCDKAEKVQRKKPVYLDSSVARSMLSRLGMPGSASPPADINTSKSLVTVRVTYLTRGVPSPCARIYRLPAASTTNGEAAPSRTNTSTDDSTVLTESSSIVYSEADKQSLRERWLSLLPSSPSQAKARSVSNTKGRHSLLLKGASRKDVAAALAADILAAPLEDASDGKADTEIPVPGEDDLIGFLTTGEFCLSAGRGVGIGSLLLSKVLDGGQSEGQAQDGQQLGRGVSTLERHLCVVRNAGESVGRLAKWEII